MINISDSRHTTDVCQICKYVNVIIMCIYGSVNY